MNEIYARMNECITKKRIQYTILEKHNKKTDEYCEFETQINALFFEFQKTKRDHDQLEKVESENNMTETIPEFKIILKKTLEESLKRITRLIEATEYETDILTELFNELMNKEVDIEQEGMIEKEVEDKVKQDKKEMDDEELHERINETIEKFIDKENVDCTLDEMKPKKRKRKQIKTKSLSKKQLLENCICYVCLENHSLLESVTTCCGHSFGKECFLTEMEKGNKCPLCSFQNPTYIEYRQRIYTKKDVEETIGKDCKKSKKKEIENEVTKKNDKENEGIIESEAIECEGIIESEAIECEGIIESEAIECEGIIESEAIESEAIECEEIESKETVFLIG